jgi:hypothetical protein
MLLKCTCKHLTQQLYTASKHTAQEQVHWKLNMQALQLCANGRWAHMSAAIHYKPKNHHAAAASSSAVLPSVTSCLASEQVVDLPLCEGVQ